MDCPKQENEQEQPKKEEQNSPSKASACKTPECEALRQKCEALEKDLEEERKKVIELERTVVEKERENGEALNKLILVQHTAATFEKDFEMERNDRARAHQQLEVLQRQAALVPDQIAESLRAEVLQTTKERDFMRDQLADYDILRDYLADCEGKYKRLRHDNAILENEMARLKDDILRYRYDMKRLCDDYEHSRQEARFYKEELEKLRISQERRRADPERNYTLKDQLDIANLMCDSLHKEKEKAETQIVELKGKIEFLVKELSMERQRGSVFSPDEEDIRRRTPGYNNGTQEYEDPQYRNPSPSHRYIMKDLSPPVNPESHSRVRTSPQLRNRDSTGQGVDRNNASPYLETRDGRSSSEGCVSFRNEEWELGSEWPPHRQPLRAGAAHTYANVPEPLSRDQHRGRIYQRPPSSSESQERDARFERYCDEEDSRYTKTLEYISLQVGDLSEAEITGVKEFVEDSRYSQEDELTKDIKLMCDMMRDLRHDRQIIKRTDLQRKPDPNLVCPTCNKQFRLGEIQKYRRHSNQCHM